MRRPSMKYDYDLFQLKYNGKITPALKNFIDQNLTSPKISISSILILYNIHNEIKSQNIFIDLDSKLKKKVFKYFSQLDYNNLDAYLSTLRWNETRSFWQIIEFIKGVNCNNNLNTFV